MENTITAISSAVGQAGIGIVRMSGDQAFAIGTKVFVPANQKSDEIQNRIMKYGKIVDGDEVIDEVLICFMKAPHTYTREDIVEIYCHGGIISVKKILDLLLKSGARLAERGEFTKRAFLNGRLDLSQAEAVIDIINSSTERSYEASIKQLEGSIGDKVKNIKDLILNILSRIEYSINFMEDAQDELPIEPILENGEEAIRKIDELLSSKNKGKIIRDGISTVIVGKPNVGKSSLLNVLLNENRAIVTDIPGTTRDTIEESINLAGVRLRITDTAGIRETDDIVESIGVGKSLELLDSADLIIAIIDVSIALDEDDKRILSLLRDRKAIVILNKTDKGILVSKEDIKGVSGVDNIIQTSMTNKEGITDLENIISEMFFAGDISSENEIFVTNSRHISLLERAKSAIESALNDLRNNITLEACEIDLRDAYELLAEITGEAIGEDVLDKIFNDFCVGK